MTEVKVYRGNDQRVEVGPLRAHEVGDVLQVPRRVRGLPHNDVVEAFEAVVDRVDSDGVAVATRRVEDAQA